MTVKLNGGTYYRNAEVCRIIGISRTTLFRWLKEGIFAEARYRDRRGWRLFTEDEVRSFDKEANGVIENHSLGVMKELILNGV